MEAAEFRMKQEIIVWAFGWLQVAESPWISHRSLSHERGHAGIYGTGRATDFMKRRNLRSKRALAVTRAGIIHTHNCSCCGFLIIL